MVARKRRPVPPTLGVPSRLAGALAALPSQGAGLRAAGAPQGWLRSTPCPPAHGIQHPTRVPPHTGKELSEKAVGWLDGMGVVAQPSC